jgi:2'-5' RNA ligase
MKLNWEKQEDEFNHVWTKRHHPPLVTTNWVENNWAKGRTDYLTFLIRIKDQQIIDALIELQKDLVAFECIDLYPSEYLHITVKEVGFLASKKHHHDDYTNEELSKVIHIARSKLKKYQPFTIKLENINHFRSTIVVQANDGGIIRNINGALLQITGMAKLKNDYPRFLPHTSIAQFKNSKDHDTLVTFLEKNREISIGSLRVDSIQLVIAQLPRCGRYPQLKTHDILKLE